MVTSRVAISWATQISGSASGRSDRCGVRGGRAGLEDASGGCVVHGARLARRSFTDLSRPEIGPRAASRACEDPLPWTSRCWASSASPSDGADRTPRGQRSRDLLAALLLRRGQAVDAIGAPRPGVGLGEWLDAHRGAHPDGPAAPGHRRRPRAEVRGRLPPDGCRRRRGPVRRPGRPGPWRRPARGRRGPAAGGPRTVARRPPVRRRHRGARRGRGHAGSWRSAPRPASCWPSGCSTGATATRSRRRPSWPSCWSPRTRCASAATSSRILAAARAGRRAEALGGYDRLRATLRDELGIDPGPEAQELHLQVLRDELAPVPAGRPPSHRTSAPAPTSRIHGREDDLAQVQALLGDAAAGLHRRAGRRRQEPTALRAGIGAGGGAGRRIRRPRVAARPAARGAGGGRGPGSRRRGAGRGSGRLAGCAARRPRADRPRRRGGALRARDGPAGGDASRALPRTAAGGDLATTPRGDRGGGPRARPAARRRRRARTRVTVAASPAVMLLRDRIADRAPALVQGEESLLRLAELTRRVDGVPLALAAAGRSGPGPFAGRARRAARRPASASARTTPASRRGTARCGTPSAGASTGSPTTDSEPCAACRSSLDGSSHRRRAPSSAATSTADAALHALVRDALVHVERTESGLSFRLLRPVRGPRPGAAGRGRRAGQRTGPASPLARRPVARCAAQRRAAVRRTGPLPGLRRGPGRSARGRRPGAGRRPVGDPGLPVDLRRHAGAGAALVHASHRVRAAQPARAGAAAADARRAAGEPRRRSRVVAT